LPDIPTSTMADADRQMAVVLGTSVVTMITGFMLGVFAVRGYLISPSLAEERRKNLNDPVESDESDIDEGDLNMDHAPNWANGIEADRRQGLRVKNEVQDKGEECKLVLVVRTDLGMTKGMSRHCSTEGNFVSQARVVLMSIQEKLPHKHRTPR
jgi:peptidyl-tRNA hydrolase, PTH2 family